MAGHDAQTVLETFPDLSIGGFMCDGEIAPIGGRAYLNGYTATLVFFVPK